MDALPVEVFATGTWGGRTWTTDDLDAMAANFTRLRDVVKPPLKLGHSNKQILAQKDGQPALGWVERLERTGTKLIAHVRDIPQTLRELIQKRRYARVSSEIYPAWHSTTWEQTVKSGVVGPVLSAVALLGAEPPEVKTLEDLGAFLATEDGVTFTESTPAEGAVALDAVVVDPFSLPSRSAPLVRGGPITFVTNLVSGQMCRVNEDGTVTPMTEDEVRARVHPRTADSAPPVGTTKGSEPMDATEKQALLDEAKAAVRAELDAEATAREAKVTDLESRLTKLSEADAAKDAELKRLAAENAASLEREVAAGRKALHLEAERFAEGMVTGEKPRLATPAQRTLAAALYERLNASDVAIKADETEPLKLAEKKDHTIRDLFVAFIEAMPSLDVILKTHSVATKQAISNDTAVLLSEIAAKNQLDLKNSDQRERAIALLNQQHPQVAPDYRVLQ